MKKQSGFSAVEVVLTIAVISLIGVVGWLVLSKDKPAPVTTSSTKVAAPAAAKKTVTAQSKPVDTTSYMKITEWGVKVPLSADVAGLSYKMEQGYTSFTTTALNTANGPSCTGFVPYVARGTASELLPSGNNMTFAQQYDSLQQYEGAVRVKVGEYYYVDPGIGRAGCSTSKTEAVSSASSAIATALNKMVAL